MPEEAAPVQPAEQGQGGSQPEAAAGLYDLSTVPEHLRPSVEAELKKIEASTTKKFQEHADFRKQWEPYQELGLHDIPQEELQSLLQFRQLASNPDTDEFRDWYYGVGQALDLLDLGEEGAAPAEDGEGDADSGLVNNLAEQLGPLLEQRLAPLEQRFQQQDEAQRLQEATDQIRTELEGLKEAHGEFDEDAVCKLALAYDGQDAIARGFEDYQRIVGASERQFVDNKLEQPSAAESGGLPATGRQSITSFADADRMARERLATG